MFPTTKSYLTYRFNFCWPNLTEWQYLLLKSEISLFEFWVLLDARICVTTLAKEVKQKKRKIFFEVCRRISFAGENLTFSNSKVITNSESSINLKAIRYTTKKLIHRHRADIMLFLKLNFKAFQLKIITI